MNILFKYVWLCNIRFVYFKVYFAHFHISSKQALNELSKRGLNEPSKQALNEP